MIDLRHGDCFEALKEIPDNSVDCIVTDPPYGNTNCDFDCIVDEKTMLAEFQRIIKPNRAVCVFCMLRMAVRLIYAAPKFFRYEWIWEKNRGIGFFSCNERPLRAHEIILVFGNGQPEYFPQYTFGKPYKRPKPTNIAEVYSPTKKIPTSNPTGKRYPVDVLHYNNQNIGSQHPTQKPVDLIEYLIRTYSVKGDCILDPFAGSGTTAVACVNSDRDFLGWELDETYFERALKRIEGAKINKAETLDLEFA